MTNSSVSDEWALSTLYGCYVKKGQRHKVKNYRGINPLNAAFN